MGLAPSPLNARPAGPESEPDMTVTFLDVAYPLRFGEMTPLDVDALEKATGRTIMALQQVLASGEADINSFAALMWLSRRQTGEKTLAYDDVAGSFNYRMFSENPPTLTTPDEAEGDSPEA
jgi:hypothetical protein